MVLTLLTVLAMETVAAAIHRFVGHGPGWALHQDHHDPGPGRLERNDAIPLVMALAAMVAFRLGLTVPAYAWLASVALGVTLYGLAYALVHDVYIHRRLPILPRRLRWLEPLRRAHLDHHRHGGAPYGVLVPMRPRTARTAGRRSRSGASVRSGGRSPG